MKYIEKSPAVLLLEDGKIFKGNAIGTKGTTSGEICFNTGMTGYQEVFTDPSYKNQLVVMTTAHIGNYGVHLKETESDSIKISGLICKNFSDVFSRIGGESDLQMYLEKNNLIGISDVDTRALVRHIRDKGAMNAIISSEIFSEQELTDRLKATPSMEGMELSSQVSVTEPYVVEKIGSKFNVALIDFGVKNNIIQCLTNRNCNVKVFPMFTALKEILEWKADGILLSNGPGDPAAMPRVIENIKEMVESGIPMFGICLGHQLLALSQGLKTTKMFNGHRGINHPVKSLATNQCEVTTQNHGFVVELNDDASDIEVSHIHLNDDTLAGIRLNKKPVFSVQYHPEASAGPHDSRYLFDEFILLMEKRRYSGVEHKNKKQDISTLLI